MYVAAIPKQRQVESASIFGQKSLTALNQEWLEFIVLLRRIFSIFEVASYACPTPSGLDLGGGMRGRIWRLFFFGGKQGFDRFLAI
jgi:hypothetical protein